MGRKNGEVQGSRIRLRSGRRWSRRQQLRQPSCRPRPCPANSCSTTSNYSHQACSKFREEKIVNSNSFRLHCSEYVHLLSYFFAHPFLSLVFPPFFVLVLLYLAASASAPGLLSIGRVTPCSVPSTSTAVVAGLLLASVCLLAALP